MKTFSDLELSLMIPLLLGGVGGWKNRFTVAQSELMDEKFSKVLKDVDICFDYE